MRITNKENTLIRTQISLTRETLEAVQQLAAKRNVSMSELIREAIDKELQAEIADNERMLSIIGMGKGSDPRGSEEHDKLIYG